MNWKICLLILNKVSTLNTVLVGRKFAQYGAPKFEIPFSVSCGYHNTGYNTIHNPCHILLRRFRFR